LTPIHKKKRTSTRGTSLLNTKVALLVLGAALACVAIVVAVNLFSGSQFKDISYIPRGEGTLLDESPGAPGNQNAGDNSAPIHPSRVSLPAEYRHPAPPALSEAQKLAFLEEKYTFMFNNLNDYYQWELARLLQLAGNDYLAVQDGRKDISLAQLANEYLKAGRSLEKEADDSFAVVQGQMKSELKANNLPLDLVKKAEQEYKAQKSQMRKDLLAQLGSYIND